MINVIKTSFGITNKFLVLATPLILFSLLSSLYLLFSMNGKIIGLVIALALFFLMFATFLSGWFYMVKICVENYETEDPSSVIKKFPEGVGEFLLSVMGMIFVAFVVSSSLLVLGYYAGIELIGELGIPLENFVKASESQTALKVFADSLTSEQILKINLWNFLILGMMSLTYFLLMFYPPVVFFKKENVFKSFFLSLKDLVSRNFLKNIMLYFSIFVSYFVLSVFTTIFGHNVITHFIFTLINFYYMVFIVVLVFNYYYQNYIKIGSKVDKFI